MFTEGRGREREYCSLKVEGEREREQCSLKVESSERERAVFYEGREQGERLLTEGREQGKRVQGMQCCCVGLDHA